MLTQKKPASPIGSWALAVLFTQTRICGGSAETEQTAVAVNPPRRSRWRVVIRVTLAARWRMPLLKAAASMLMSHSRAGRPEAPSRKVREGGGLNAWTHRKLAGKRR